MGRMSFTQELKALGRQAGEGMEARGSSLATQSGGQAASLIASARGWRGLPR